MPTVKTQIKVDRLHQSGAANNQILKYNGTAGEWEPGDSPSGADGNGIYTGSGNIGSNVNGSYTRAKIPELAKFSIDYNNNANAIRVFSLLSPPDDPDDIDLILSTRNQKTYTHYYWTNGMFTKIENTGYYGINSPNGVVITNDDSDFQAGIAQSAVLDLDSTVGAFYPPRMTTTQRTTMTTAGIDEGALIYNSTTDKLNLRVNNTWVELQNNGDGNGIYSGSGTIGANAAAKVQDDSSFSINYFNDLNAFNVNDQFGIASILSGNGNATAYTNNTEAAIKFNNNIVSTDTNSIDLKFNTNVHQFIIDSTGARLDSTTKMLRPPRMTTVQRGNIVTPEEGGILYNTDTKKLTYRTDNAFIELSAASSSGIYGGSGTIPTATVATLVTGGNFTIDYFGGVDAIRVDDTDTSVRLQSKNGNADLFVGNTGSTITFSTNNVIAEVLSVGARLAYDDGGSAPQQLVVDNTGVRMDSTTKMFRPPRMTTGQRDLIATPETGGLLYDTTSNRLTYRNNSQFVEIMPNQAGFGGIYGGSGSIPNGTIAKLTSGGSFVFDYNNDRDAISISDGGSILISNNDVGVNKKQLGVDSTGVYGDVAAGTVGFLHATAGTRFRGAPFYVDEASNNSLDSGAAFQVDSSNKTLLIPRMATDPAGATSGGIVYNTATTRFSFRQNGAWINYMVDAAGNGGIYKGSGTIAADAVATVTNDSTFTIKYNGNANAIQVIDTPGSERTQLSSKTPNQTSLILESGFALLHGPDGTGIELTLDRIGTTSDWFEIGSAAILNVNTQASISANQNNYAIGNATIIRVESTLNNVEITGIQHGKGLDNFADASGRILYICNISDTETIRCMANNAGSHAEYRFISLVPIQPNSTKGFWYDGVSARWRPLEGL